MKTIKTNTSFDIPENYTGIVKYSWGTKEWYLNGNLHRRDGPAIEYPNGEKEWCLNGKLHREDGPAVEYADGAKEYWLNSEFLNEDKIDQLINEFDYPVETAIKLTYFIS